MRILLRILILLIVLLVAGLGALALALPGIVKSDAVRARIESAGAEALGREVRFAELDFGLLPPSLVVVEPSVAGAAEGDPPLVRAEQVALRVALLPLLARSVVVDSLVVEGASLRLVRTPDGIELPRPGSRKPSEPEPEPEAEAGSGVALAVRRLSLRDTTLVLEDRAVKPAVTWELRETEIVARGESLEEPIAFDARAVLASGGRIAAEGSATLEGALRAELRLEGLTLAPLRPYLTQAGELAGALSGSVTVAGTAARPETIALDLELAEGRVAVQDVGLRGGLGLKADLSGGLGALAGPFELDATRAELRYGEAFHKPPGRQATLSGRLVTRDGGELGIEGAALRLHEMKAQGSLQTGRRTRLAAQFEPFEIGGWEEMIPALGGYGLAGELRLGELRAATSPLELHASVPLEGLRAQHPEAGPVQLRGTLLARGDRIETRDVQLVAAEQTISVQAQLRELGGTPSFQVATRTEKADTNRIVSALTSRRDTFYGLLDFDGDLSGSLGDEPLLRSLRGRTAIDVRDGRIVGLSLLSATFEAIAGQGTGGLAGLGVDLASALTGRNLARFYGEDFESLTGTLRVADAVASTNDMRLVYGDYTVDLKGDVGLESGKYEMSGRLTLGAEIDAALAVQLGAQPPSGKKPHVIPIGLVGDLGQPFDVRRGNPRLRVTSDVAQTLVSRYVLDRYRDQIDEKLGPGASDALRDAIDIFGGQRRH